MSNLIGCMRYVVLELDDGQHVRLGLVQDLFRVNWFVNARFRGRKVYVVRLNPDGYERGDGLVVEGPCLRERLERLVVVLRHQHRQRSTDATHVRVVYLYYSPDRLRGLLHRAGCRVSTVEEDVEYSVVFAPHADPGYLAQLQSL